MLGVSGNTQYYWIPNTKLSYLPLWCQIVRGVKLSHPPPAPPPTPLAENHFAKKRLAELGGTPLPP